MTRPRRINVQTAPEWMRGFLKQVSEEMTELFPGYDIEFVTNLGEKSTSAELLQDINGSREALRDGRCIECGAALPGFPSDMHADEWRDFRPPVGWKLLADLMGMPRAWQCPACAASLTDCDLNIREDGDDLGGSAS